MTPDIDLDALTALLDDAKTELPWTARFNDRTESTFDDIMIEGGIDAMVAIVACNPEKLRLIVGAVNNLPALLSALTATRAELDKAVRQRDSLARRCAVRFGETETARAERDHLRQVLDAANATTEAAQRIVTAALADGTATITPAAGAGDGEQDTATTERAA